MTRCPSLAELAEFNLGKPVTPVWEAVAEHVAVCDGCTRQLGSLSNDSDNVLAQVRSAVHRAAVGPLPDSQAGRDSDTWRLADNSSVARAISLSPPACPVRIGAYELLEQIGKGGMGVVYRARHAQLNRIVAVKMILPQAHPDSPLVARFRQEGQAIARLQHPHVVQVHEFNEHQGQPYLVMEWVEGGSLQQRLREQPLAAREAAQLVRQLSLAVHAAHKGNILHRDLKPGNVLITSDGVPKLSDFGLAKMIDLDQDHTQSDMVLGTASYMAPEQAEGRVRDLDARTDVYGLGAILYETLAGRPPFREGARMQTLDAVRFQEPIPPRRLKPEISRDLEAVCLKCLAKDPAERYDSAEQLADDLNRWLKGRPTLARPAPWWAVMRRHPKLTMTALMALLVGALAVAAWRHYDPDRPLREIESRLVRGEAVTLIGDTQAPRWSKVVAGAQSLMTIDPPEDAFQINTLNAGLLELTPDPLYECFRFSAEFRHDHSIDGSGTVGIYFGRRVLTTETELGHSFTTIEFHGVKSREQFFREQMAFAPPNFPKNAPPPLGNPVLMCRRLLVEGNDHGPLAHLGHWQSHLTPTNEFVRKAWHRVALTVLADRIEVEWDGKREVLTNDAYVSHIGDPVRKERLRMATPLYRQLSPDLHARGGLGLFVYEGAVSFRRVTLEPLPKSTLLGETAP